ncbi:4'-phosphopantetheinyl transferase family protein [Paenibacillus pseudetheri]|uniref:4'-phosphopantetheinyl transferase Sfp n=1 Tax=Paenibacillus pseudetheri TaxID=2897682 RepID=A0ABM9BK82_9BACL|nr:4'-phosphopantetheinyl transferase superfamily protein [Paenibacillus pseudetheri]CAH1059013.1 4'-phosphopantetheinyl transferase Sfp [Paenibacillus pseudetheri]
MAQLHAVSVTEPLPEDIFERLLVYLDPQKQAKIRRYYHSADALRSMVAELLVRTMTCSGLSLLNGQLEFQSNEWGKPYVVGIEHYHYNISHARDWVVCAVDSEPVGVDVEYITPIDLTIAERFFSLNEADYLASLPTVEQIDRFFDFWTLKESYIKAQGKGLSCTLNAFSFRFEENSEIRLQTTLDHKRCYFRQYPLDPRYKLSLCLHRNDFPVEVKVLSLHELVRQFQLYL